MTASLMRLVAASTLLAGACGGAPDQPAVAVRPQTVSQASENHAPPAACTLVTAAEMSNIIGMPLISEFDQSVGSTTCRYKPAAKETPFVELIVDWGNGEVAMMSTGLLGRLEPGIANAMEGIGDQAAAIGPRLMIRTGEDLVTLTLWGIDDQLPRARRIVETMRPRMGPTSQPAPPATAAANAGNGSSQDDARRREAAEAMKVASQFLGGILGGRPQDDAKTPAAAASNGGPAAKKASEADPEELVFRAFSGRAVRVPLVAGLRLIDARHERDRGDYEPMMTVTAITKEAVESQYSAALPEGRQLTVDRRLPIEDLEQARGYRSIFYEGDPETFPGTTAFSFSRAVLNDLRSKGEANLIEMVPPAGLLDTVLSIVGGANAGDLEARARRPMLLKRVEPHTLAIPVLLNEDAVELPAIHARGTFDGETIDFYVLDDPDNPLVLHSVTRRSSGRTVRIAYPVAVTSDAPALEEKLRTDARVELHGIYFDFGKATIRPESEGVLREIATALGHNPDWKIGIEGHTDNIGGDEFNLDLSRRRADAVRQALIDRYQVPAQGLATAGFGAAKPQASNATLLGRARNRRVELVRQ